MSRSYKHTPRCGEQKSKYFKRYANHIVRRNKLKELYPQHSGYRKIYERWDICDYQILWTSFEEYYAFVVESWHKWRYRFPGEPFPNRKECKKEYEKWYIRK